MEIKPAHRVQNARSPVIPDLTERAADLVRTGRDVVDLSGAAVALPPPPGVADAARAALDNDEASTDETRATDLATAIVTKFERDNDLRFGTDQIVVTHGARHALHLLMQALLNDDDEVIVPAPYWPGYPDLVRLAGADPVIVRTRARNRFRMTPEELRGALGPRTRLVILNSPCNPSGVVYGRGELESLARVLAEFPEVVVVCDDVYEYLCRTREPFATLLKVAPRLHDRTVIVNAVSEAWGMGRWRIGFAAGPARLLAAMRRIQSRSSAPPGPVAQAAAAAALAAPREHHETRNTALGRSHERLYRALSDLPGIDVQPAEGGYHLLVFVGRVLGTRPDIDDDVALATWLLEEHGVVTSPGTACGMPGYLRLSYAADDAVVAEATRRLCAALSPPQP
ncbi:MAG: aminotransferase class I/II-fold pyridoxal phosphate-dependent enzyme [Gammaproteobacteria bacterium]